ncbi:MAG: type II toxin-antitoxin system VapC family toxin [Methanosarcinales archaeon]
MLINLPIGSIVFIDSNIFIYVALEDIRYKDICKEFLRKVNDGKYNAVISAVVISEVFHVVLLAELAELFNISQKEVVRLIKSNPIFIVANAPTAMSSAKKPWQAVEDIKNINNISILEIGYYEVDYASPISKQYNLLMNDSLHLAVMKKHGIQDIATNDSDFDRVDNIQVWKP